MEEQRAIFTGSELKSSGTTKEGKPWTLFRLNMKPTMESDKSFGMSLFKPQPDSSLKLDDLKQGTRYKFVFKTNDYTNKEGKQVTSKTCVLINEDDGAENPAYKPKEEFSKPETNRPQHMIINQEQFTQFSEKYFLAMKGANKEPGLNHMIGSYFKAFNAEMIEDLVKLCQAKIAFERMQK